MADYAIHDTTLEAIADTIRKKDGTQALIDPADYADRINLMGMLEEKTISGAVASCSDGADRVPIKAWEIDIPATVSGISAINCIQSGVNLISNSASAWEQGNINTSGANSTGNEYVRTVGYYEIKGGADYEISGIATPSTASDFRLFFYDASKTFISYKNYGSTPRTFPTNACYMRVRNIGTDDMTNLQIQFGTTASTYTAYTPPIITNVPLGQTVYGGAFDVVNGIGHTNVARVKFSDLNWTYYTGGTNPIFYAQNVPNMKTYARGEVPNIAIDGYTTRFAQSRSFLSTNMANMECSAIEEFQTITFRNTSYTSKDAMLAALGDEYIVYEVSDSTSFTFSPMSTIPETVLGTTTLFADIGNSSVIYRTNGTVTPVLPTLITKSITENGTYNASSDNVDGYSQVTVNVPTAPSGMLVMNFTNISSPFTLNGVSYGATGAVFDNTSDYIDLPFFHAGMEIEIDVASISLGQNANRRFFSSYRNQGFLYRNNNVWSFYNGSWYDTDISDSAYFDNSTVKIVVDSNNYWHIYKDDVLIFEPAGACAISEPAIGSKDGSCINNATITGIRIKEVTS